MQCEAKNSTAATGPASDTFTKSVAAWNGSPTVYPREMTVAQVFEEVVAAHRDSVAVVCGSKQLTYGQLNSRANRLAHHLRRLGVGPEVMVGCCLERSLELIVALIAVLKAGGGYVPIDPQYPKERFEFILADAQTVVMLTHRALASTSLAQCHVPCFLLDDDNKQTSDYPDSNPTPVGSADSLAYVMYTSGSTGRPKGVAVENRAIVRLVRNTNYCQFSTNEVFLLFAPISFDASTFEIWGPLLNGGRLVIMPPQASSLDDLGRAIREHQVTTLWLTAGLFHLMVDQRLQDLRPIRQLLAGGDVLSPRHVRLVLEKLPDCRMINGYGPTENTTFTCCHVMRHGDLVAESVPIGVPISNTKVYILDENLCPVAPGVVGELYAAGDGLARGYFNNAAATAERFLPNPFATQNDRRMYRTGDLARWREDGVVEFLGRADGQVKILGHRVEPGEVESILGAHMGLAQTCVVPIGGEEGSKRLAAYYVAKATPGVTPDDLRLYLATRLPQYMVPTFFIPMPSLPLSPNGKVDRSALPAPQVLTTGQISAEGPTTKMEQIIAELWQDVLRVPAVSLDDNFFDLGGDSLLLIAVHAKLQKELPTEIQITDLFEFPTIRGLARQLNGSKSEQSLPKVNDQGQKQRAAFAQQRQRRAGRVL